jgi:hypothetical protein
MSKKYNTLNSLIPHLFQGVRFYRKNSLPELSNQQGIQMQTNSNLENKANFLSKIKEDIKNPNYLYYLGGFFEGEGSCSVSISVGSSFKYGINLQPVFNVSQHRNGIALLYSFKELFESGSVVDKSGSDLVMVYTIKGYKHIISRVLPFLETYVQPFSCKTKEYEIFKELVIKSSEGQQKDRETLIEMVKLAYTFSGKGKGRKRSLSEILEIINNKEKYFSSL